MRPRSPPAPARPRAPGAPRRPQQTRGRRGRRGRAREDRGRRAPHRQRSERRRHHHVPRASRSRTSPRCSPRSRRLACGSRRACPPGHVRPGCWPTATRRASSSSPSSWSPAVTSAGGADVDPLEGTTGNAAGPAPCRGYSGRSACSVSGLVHGIPIRHAIETKLEASSRTALDAAGASGVTVDFTGRDGVLTGTLPAGMTAEDLVTRLQDLDGVRVVRADFGAAQDEARGRKPRPSPDTAPTGDATPTAGASPSVEASAGGGTAEPSISVAATSGQRPTVTVAATAGDGDPERHGAFAGGGRRSGRGGDGEVRPGQRGQPDHRRGHPHRQRAHRARRRCSGRWGPRTPPPRHCPRAG